MSAPGAPAEIAARDALPVSGHGCPECGARFHTAHPRRIFCHPTCKRAWEKRADRRGAQILSFAIVARVTRGGDRGDKATGLKAARDLDILIQRWREEDRAACRMDAMAFLALRYRLGYDRP